MAPKRIGHARLDACSCGLPMQLSSVSVWRNVCDKLLPAPCMPACACCADDSSKQSNSEAPPPVPVLGPEDFEQVPSNAQVMPRCAAVAWLQGGLGKW